jgi:cellulose synthase/poly-beta-1,6-N-acetylglucosamine synthase-like glycosyltransferase
MAFVSVLFFLVGAFFVFYFFIGYPLLLLVLGRVRRRPIHRAPGIYTVSVIIPVRNGERWMEAKLKSVFSLQYPREKMQVIVVNDGSTDRTAELARSFAGVEVLELSSGGKCRALNAALEHATGEILFLTDVRQPLDPQCLSQLLMNYADPSIGVASGELVITTGELMEHAQIGLYMRYEEWLRKRISEISSVPGATGAVYTMRRKLAVPLPEDCLLDDVYLPMAAYFQGYRVVLDGSAIAYDYPTRIEAEFGRKVRTLGGLFQIVGYYPRLLNPRYDIWLHFVSHKLSRLLLPYAFAWIAVSSWFLPDPWRWVVLAAQALFYGVALVDPWIPEGNVVKRLSSLVRTFVMLLAASVAAGSILFRPARTLWTERKS